MTQVELTKCPCGSGSMAAFRCESCRGLFSQAVTSRIAGGDERTLCMMCLRSAIRDKMLAEVLPLIDDLVKRHQATVEILAAARTAAEAAFSEIWPTGG